MPAGKLVAIAQINDVLRSDSHTEESITLACAALKRLSPPGSVYLERMETALNTFVVGSGNLGAKYGSILNSLHGILSALRADYQEDRLQSYNEIIHADLFSDFLEMAEHFLQSGYKDPAAVIAGGVLEEHLRKLCVKHGVAQSDKPKLDTMNSELAKALAYTKNDQKQVTAWAGIRNDAAHGHYDKYDIAKVEFMVRGIRHFISQNPA
jgi:hypothetical protein